MTIILLNGETWEHPNCRARVRKGVLYVIAETYVSSETVACYPLMNIARWTP